MSLDAGRIAGVTSWRTRPGSARKWQVAVAGYRGRLGGSSRHGSMAQLLAGRFEVQCFAPGGEFRGAAGAPTGGVDSPYHRASRMSARPIHHQ